VAYQHATAHSLPSSLLKWMTEIKILSKVLSLDYNGAYVEWEKLKGYSKRDTHSATSSAIVSLILTHLKGYDTAFIHCKYALLRLIAKPLTSPVSSLFLFISLYSSLKLLDHCKMVTDPEYTNRRSSVPSSTTASSANQLVGWDVMTSRMTLERAKTVLKLLVPLVLQGMRVMKTSATTFPITTVLYHTLLLLQTRINIQKDPLCECLPLTSSSQRHIDCEAWKTQFQQYQSFKFGMAYYHHERSLTLMEYGEKYRSQAQQAEDLSMRLFRDSVSGNTNSIRASATIHKNFSFPILGNDKSKEEEEEDEKEDEEGEREQGRQREMNRFDERDGSLEDEEEKVDYVEDLLNESEGKGEEGRLPRIRSTQGGGGVSVLSYKAGELDDLVEESGTDNSQL
jgi:hypothetical protein